MKTFTAIDPDGKAHETNSSREFTHASLYFLNDKWNVIGFSGSEKNAKRALSQFKSQFKRAAKENGYSGPKPEFLIVEVEAEVAR
jgi:hypothetical protein